MVSKNEESSIGKVLCNGELSNQMQQTSFEFVVEKILGSFVDKVRNYYLNKFLIKIVCWLLWEFSKDIKIVCWLLWEFSKDETIGPLLPSIVHVKAVVEKNVYTCNFAAETWFCGLNLSKSLDNLGFNRSSCYHSSKIQISGFIKWKINFPQKLGPQDFWWIASSQSRKVNLPHQGLYVDTSAYFFRMIF